MIDPEKYPQCFARQAVEKLFPGIITPGTLANLAAKDQGPKFEMLKGKAVYITKDFIEWLEADRHRKETSRQETHEK